MLARAQLWGTKGHSPAVNLAGSGCYEKALSMEQTGGQTWGVDLKPQQNPNEIVKPQEM